MEVVMSKKEPIEILLLRPLITRRLASLNLSYTIDNKEKVKKQINKAIPSQYVESTIQLLFLAVNRQSVMRLA